MTLHLNFSKFRVPSGTWLKLVLTVAFPLHLLHAQSGSASAESSKNLAPEKGFFDREWRKTAVDIDLLKVLASNYSLDAGAIRTRVMDYLDKAKGNVSVPPYAIRTTGYVPETSAYNYFDEARNWPEICARLRVVLAACDAELDGEARREKWQFMSGYWLKDGDPAALTLKTRRDVARRVVLHVSDMLNAGNHPNDRDFATHSSSWLVHLIRRGWLSELLASLEPPRSRFSRDEVLSITNKAAIEVQKLGGLENTACAVQLLKVLAPRFIRPEDGNHRDDLHYNLAVMYLSMGCYDQARSEAALLQPDGNLASCTKYFDKLIAATKAQEAADKAAKKKPSTTSLKPKPRP